MGGNGKILLFLKGTLNAPVYLLQSCYKKQCGMPANGLALDILAAFAKCQLHECRLDHVNKQ